MAESYDAILVLSFGGPEGPDDVIPFLENVLRGRRVPRERMLEVAEHYQHFGGVSPINAQCRALIAALKEELAQHGPNLPIYWGNRNWHPMLADTLRTMVADGVKRAVVFVTSAFSSYSGCRQYREDLFAASEQVGPGCPEFAKLRVFWNHPGFIGPMIERVREALEKIPAERRANARVAFTAHSIPQAMADGCRYVAQLTEATRLVAEGAGAGQYALVYQSRSGRPGDPWLEPDVVDHLKALRAEGVEDVVVSPIGFISDHMEVMYDLDDEAQKAAKEIGLNMVRAGTVGVHPDFIRMIRELIVERIEQGEKRVVGNLPANPDVCFANCCLPGGRPPGPALCQQPG
ncbi:MAG TPA: ferrochelatase [Pirellulales bacterium]